jgi:hypothetical protein
MLTLESAKDVQKLVAQMIADIESTMKAHQFGPDNLQADVKEHLVLALQALDDALDVIDRNVGAALRLTITD